MDLTNSIRWRDLGLAASVIAGALISGANAVSATAQTATDRYIEARDRAIAESSGATTEDQQRKDLGILQGLLRQALEPFSNPGVEPDGQINLDTLAPELGFGRLDGLVYKSRDGDTEILVTNRTLVNSWLTKFYDLPTGVRRDLAGVLASEAQSFMTQAWATEDKHFTLLNRLPGTTHTAVYLGELSADDANYVPNSILGVVVDAERIYLVSQRLAVHLPTVPGCDRLWQRLWDQSKSEAAASAFARCYAGRVTTTPAYRAAVAQAQRFMSSLIPSSKAQP